MPDIYVDTKKMRDCGKDLLDQAKELNETIDAFFNRISAIPTLSEWVGAPVEQFVALANSNKADFLIIKEAIVEYGNYLIDSAEQFEKVIGNIRVNQ